MTSLANSTELPLTRAARRALRGMNSAQAADDLRFLENWDTAESQSLGAILRAGQIRRANPGLAAEIAAELAAEPIRIR